MSRLALLMVATVATSMVSTVSTASAGPFGGFAGTDSYLARGDRLCKLVATTTGAARTGTRECTKLSAAAVARLSLEKAKNETGPRARFRVVGSGTKLVVTANGSNDAAFSWDSGSPVGRVTAVFINKAGTAVAVEYETRFGGRMVADVVGFRMATPTTPTRPTRPTTPVVTPKTPTAPALSDEVAKKLEAALRGGWKQLKRKRYKRAITAANKGLALWDQSAEALAILASAHARLKDKAAALAALDRLAASTDPLAPEYRVEARTATAFASLRANPQFRRAVGITRDPKRPLSAYERVMGFGGKWEQRLIACDQPEVKLKLRRTRKRFTLRIRARCGGPAETTFLDGTWLAVGTDALRLTFPNQGADDEPLTCAIERCRDTPGEDCVRCKVDQDLEFLLRVIRR